MKTSIRDSAARTVHATKVFAVKTGLRAGDAASDAAAAKILAAQQDVTTNKQKVATALGNQYDALVNGG